MGGKDSQILLSNLAHSEMYFDEIYSNTQQQFGEIVDHLDVHITNLKKCQYIPRYWR